MKETIPISEKVLLTLDEASAYYGLGLPKLRELTDGECPYVIWNGTKRLIKREKFEEYLLDLDYI